MDFARCRMFLYDKKYPEWSIEVSPALYKLLIEVKTTLDSV